MDETTPPPIHVKQPKNGVRRLTMILVIILLLLSVGFLIWQLWPVIGDKVQEMISFLKNNI
jgi:cell division septal protein FtsQ